MSNNSPAAAQRALALAPAFRRRRMAAAGGTEFPHDNFRDLFDAGLMRAALPVEAGGLGISVEDGAPASQWAITRALATGDMSTARIYEGHVNNIEIVGRFAETSVRDAVFAEIRDRGACLAGWSAEPRDAAAATPTTARIAPDGWLLNGAKTFASGAGGVSFALIAASIEGSNAGDLSGHHLFLVDTDAPGITIDRAWWEPMGMQGSASHRVILGDVFVPRRHRVVPADDLVRQHWGARIAPHHCATFLGGADSAFEIAREYLAERSSDDLSLHRLAKMRVAQASADGLMNRAAQMWQESPGSAQAIEASHLCRIGVQEAVLKIAAEAATICGASHLMLSRPLPGLIRDLEFYVRHDRIDRLLTETGRALLAGSGQCGDRV